MPLSQSVRRVRLAFREELTALSQVQRCKLECNVGSLAHLDILRRDHAGWVTAQEVCVHLHRKYQQVGHPVGGRQRAAHRDDHFPPWSAGQSRTQQTAHAGMDLLTLLRARRRPARLVAGGDVVCSCTCACLCVFAYRGARAHVSANVHAGALPGAQKSTGTFPDMVQARI
eukprot:364721-Chlamydomonas_euryale.AAC.7